MAIASSSKLEKCEVGMCLSVECHKLTYCRKIGFLSSEELGEEDKKLLYWRSGICLKDHDRLCFHHEKIYLSRYESLQKYCADPFSLHKKHITKSLRAVDENTATELNLKPGQKLCSECYKRKDNMRDGEFMMSEEEYQPLDQLVTSLSKTATSLNVTPIKTSVSKRDKLSYGKRKVKQLHTAVKAKCAHALDLPVDELQSPDDSHSETDTDLDKLITLLKDKLKIAPKQEKIKLLTLTPESWTREKTMREFGVTEHMVRRARQLKKEKGILADPDTKKGRPLSHDISERIVHFYQSDEHSRMCPGKKEYVIIRVNNIKEYKQKRLLLVNLKELYVEYTKRYPADKVGFSKFCEVRPKWCIPVTASGMHAVCVCEHHQNVKLKTAAIPGNDGYKEILLKLVCSTENRNCMLHLCDLCPGKIAIQEYLSDLFRSHDFDFDDSLVYKQWIHANKSTQLVDLTVSVQEFIEIASDAFDELRQHHFIAKSQSSYLRKLKEDLAPDSAVILLDFAENYSFIVQDAVQGHYWDNSQASLHPFVVYYRSEDELKCLSLCILSDCLKHDTVTVHSFISTMISYLKTVLPSIKKLIYFSDGAAGQYKNYKNFTNLCNHKSDHGLEAEWHFFATSHGKSPCDGIGGTVKRLVSRASLQATTEDHILTVRQMFVWASHHITGVNFFLVSAEQVAENAAKFDLAARFDSAKTISGTRSHHCFIPVSEGELNMKRISADTNVTMVIVDENKVLSHPSTLPDSEHNIHDKLQPGKYVASIYDKEWYVGNIVERADEHSDVLLNFMKRSQTGALSWPPASRRDQCWVPFHDIICLIDAPELQGHGARSYKLSTHDAAQIIEKLSAFL